ncbi:hypothetical protein [Streptomyces sp. 769]|uniref:hypothetical protein n=1 Tax=Streptomyces sp. 769 TaxID=1262452 RepID=UPI000581EAE4|nr:hypothetical protein [Streptomyces sp. 769]AJC62035.1 hypothetical protein GZL_p00105 [Streptomyces sp. 769]
MSEPTMERTLTTGQRFILGAAAVPMVVIGAIGGYATYSNIKTVTHQSATAMGVVAAGEGATLILALVYVGLTLLGQSSPTIVRLGLWALPAVASVTGAEVAQNSRDALIYAVTPMAMCAAAEGLGLVARRIVIYCTGVNSEQRRRNAATLQRLAYLRARAAKHPGARQRRRAELKSWRVAQQVGAGDEALGGELVTDQRERLKEIAGDALVTMLAVPATPALAGSVTPALGAGETRDGSTAEGVTETGDQPTPVTPSVTADGDRDGSGHDASVSVSGGVVQVKRQTVAQASRPTETVTDSVTPSVTPPVVTDESSVSVETDTNEQSVTPGAVTDDEASHLGGPTLDEVAAVAGVSTPQTGVRLDDDQLVVVLRFLRYSDAPPLSYRQAQIVFRDAGYVGSEQRVRRAWGSLMSTEETGGDDGGTDAEEEDVASDDASDDEEDDRPSASRN